jgi:hypothetical protein
VKEMVKDVPLVVETASRTSNSVMYATVPFKTIMQSLGKTQLEDSWITLYETNKKGEPQCQIPVQCDFHTNRIYWILPAGPQPSARFYRLHIDPSSTVVQRGSNGMVEVRDDGKALHFVINGDEFAVYWYSDEWKPFFYPVNSPYGSVVRGRGEEHPHQHGLWITYGGEGTGPTGMWSEQTDPPLGPNGRMVHRGFWVLKSGPVFAHMVEDLDYLRADGIKFGHEVRDIKVYNLPADQRIIDWHLAIAPPDDMTINRYIVFAVRVADSMRITMLTKGYGIENAPRLERPGKVINSEGWSMYRDRQRGASMPARWIDFSGPVGNGWAGITLMDHPTNVEYPSHMGGRVYGCVTIRKNYPSTIPVGSRATLELKFRAYVHVGDGEEANSDGKWSDFANAPTVIVDDPV